MKISKLAAAASIAVLAATAISPALAQYQGQNPGPGNYYNGQAQYPGYNGSYNDPRDNDYRNGNPYQDGYRAGYEDARANRRFDDRIANDRYDNRPVANDRDRLWTQRYTRVSTYADDNYYRECRQTADPAGVIAGALIGGLLGNTAVRGNARPAATVAGVIVGGALGASLTRNLDCEDRSYSYKAYYDGFNAGRPNQQYAWRNPRNGRNGVLNVGQYYNDPDGFRCATFSQAIYINGRPQEGRGRACQQPDGSWAIVG